MLRQNGNYDAGDACEESSIHVDEAIDGVEVELRERLEVQYRDMTGKPPTLLMSIVIFRCRTLAIAFLRSDAETFIASTARRLIFAPEAITLKIRSDGLQLQHIAAK